jgi:hypothetical protein
LKCFEAVVLRDKQVEAGVWECSPGIWRRQILQAELCHFVSGYAFFTPEGGDKFEIKAGDAVFFRPAHKASGMSEKPSVSPTSHLITEFQIRSTTEELSMLPSHSLHTKTKPVILSSPEADEESAWNPARC